MIHSEELAESISVHGVLEPLIVRSVTERDFEVVVGGRRFAASKKAGKDDAPCSIRNLTDAQVLEIQLVENLQRRDVHPLEEAHGFHALLNLEEPKYTIEQIGAKVGKAPAYVALHCGSSAKFVAILGLWQERRLTQKVVPLPSSEINVPELRLAISSWLSWPGLIGGDGAILSTTSWRLPLRC